MHKNTWIYSKTKAIFNGSLRFRWKIDYYLIQSLLLRAIVACGASLNNAAQRIGSYDSLQGAGNRDYCVVATQGVSKRNPCWRGWRPVVTGH